MIVFDTNFTVTNQYVKVVTISLFKVKQLEQLVWPRPAAGSEERQ